MTEGRTFGRLMRFNIKNLPRCDLVIWIEYAKSKSKSSEDSQKRDDAISRAVDVESDCEYDGSLISI